MISTKFVQCTEYGTQTQSLLTVRSPQATLTAVRGVTRSVTTPHCEVWLERRRDAGDKMTSWVPRCLDIRLLDLGNSHCIIALVNNTRVATFDVRDLSGRSD